MAQIIQHKTGYLIKTEILLKIVEESFTDEALVKFKSKYFINYLLDIDPDLVIWSEGDVVWQMRKATKVGLASELDDDSMQFYEQKKPELGKILRSVDEATEINSITQVVILDDKTSNIAYANGLQSSMSTLGINISTFKIDLTQANTNLEQCLLLLNQLKKKSQIRLVVDMDGVLINTDKVLFEIVPPQIISLLDD